MSGNYIVADLAFQSASRDPRAFDAFLDSVADELEKLGISADVTASLENYEASFCMEADDRTPDTFINHVTALRTALHAAECGTPGWPSTYQFLVMRSVAPDLTVV